jgi:hypothetical protein
MPQQPNCHRQAIKVGLIVAGVHTFIVLAVLLKVLSLSDGTAKWGISMGLAWTIEIWTVPLYTHFDWDWGVQSFYLLCLLGGGVLYFLMAYAGTRFVLRLNDISRNKNAGA